MPASPSKVSDPDHEILGERHERWTGPRSVLELHSPKPHVVLVRGKGHGTKRHAEIVIEWRERALASGQTLVLLDDLEEMTTYEPEVRIMLTRWIHAHRARIDSMHVLLRSKLARMGVSVANLALGGFIKSYERRADFEAVVRRATGA